MIREQIKKDLKKAIEKSGVLEGNFLDNIEWLLKTVNKDNFEDFAAALPVGKLRPEIQKVIGAKNELVYLKPRIYAKINGWWQVYAGHPEITTEHFFLLPYIIACPEQILRDKTYKDRFLLVHFLEHTTALVVEVLAEGNEVVTFFWMREDQPREHKLLWAATAKEKWTPDGRTCIPSVLALRRDFGVAGSRFPSLRQKVHHYLTTIERKCQEEGVLSYPVFGLSLDEIYLEHPANPQYGDYSSNVAMTIKSVKLKAQSSKLKADNPRELAETIVKHFPKVDYLEKIEVAAPGFINFYLKDAWLQDQVGAILKAGGDYGVSSKFKIQNSKLKVQVEFISANPTGPLTAGNARGGFAGDVLANVLSKMGYRVQREYYINDRGVQVEKLAESVKAHYDAVVKSLTLYNVDIPEGGYRGEYVRKIARKLYQKQTDADLQNIKSFSVSEILKEIKKTIRRMGIKFDNLFSEESLYATSQVEKTLKRLDDEGLTYEKDGAVWIKTSKYGDDKDRVLVKSDGEMTYLVSDIAYHWDKFEKRKFDKVILFWGADHHGYVPRFLAMMEAMGYQGQAQVELIQLLKLARGGKEVRMSKRAGEYVTVDDVLDEIGLDAARFHFLRQPLSTPMTLDLEKAKEQSEKNPVYYVQYACARMHSILAKTQNSKFRAQSSLFRAQSPLTLRLSARKLSQSSKLTHSQELALIRKLIQLPEIIVDISQNHEVHRLPQYSIEVADAFHRFYENCQVLSDDAELTRARLGLVEATRIMLTETLGLLGISAPERM